MTRHNILLVGLLFAACSSSSLPGTGAPNGGSGGALGAGGVGTGGVGTGGIGTGGAICDGVSCVNGVWTLGPCGPSGWVPPPGHVRCDLAKAGVECVTTGVCPVLDGGDSGTGTAPDRSPDIAPSDLPVDVAMDAPVADAAPDLAARDRSLDIAPSEARVDVAMSDSGPGGRGGNRGASCGSAGGTTGGGGVLYPFSSIPGYGWVNLGIKDTLTSPTCDCAPISGQPPAAFAMAPTSSCPTSSIVWEVFNGSFPNALCISGSIPALPAMPVQRDYDENWGIMAGFTFTASVPAGYKSVSFNANNSDTPIGTPVRGAIHLKGDPDDQVYCSDHLAWMAPFADFHTPCRTSSGGVDRSLQDSDVPKIDRVGILVEPGDSAFTVRNLCLYFVAFYDSLTGTGGSQGNVGVAGNGGATGSRTY
jgi:hypothetical protein